MAEPWPRPRARAVYGLVRRGVTLTELLVAAALALVMMGAVASLFGLFGQSVKQSQATMSQTALLRSAAWQLRQDLAGATCPLTPWLAPEVNAGYFEIIEGPDNDSAHAFDTSGQPNTNLEADTDDILLFTTQSLGENFVGRFEYWTKKQTPPEKVKILVESPYAEVAWFCRPAARQPLPGTTLYDLHRRQLLIINYLGLDQEDMPDNTLPLSTTDRAGCDISLRIGTIPTISGMALIPNSLGDLTKRENRFMRADYRFVVEKCSHELPKSCLGGSVFQYVVPEQNPRITCDHACNDGTVSLSGTRIVATQPFPSAFPVDVSVHAVPEAALDGTRRSTEDHVLNNVIGFDVRVFDPQAVVSGADGRVPGDPGYVAPSALQPGDSRGAYVDLGWGGGSPVVLSRNSRFPPPGQTALQSAGMSLTGDGCGAKRFTLPSPTYDTWSRHYECNGINEDGDVEDLNLNGKPDPGEPELIDEGVNGAGATVGTFLEDTMAPETSPPYPVPLRGLEVRIRCYEPSSKQVRQVTIRHAFPK